MKIIAFAGSTSKTSINKQLVSYAASLLKSDVKVLDLNDYSAPIFSVDTEKDIEYPAGVEQFNTELESADAFLVSLAEHNGSFTAAFKNLFDWASRKEAKLFRGKPMLLMATSPGARGGASVLGGASADFPYRGADIKATFSLPSFYDNFKEGKIVNLELNEKLNEAVEVFKKSL